MSSCPECLLISTDAAQHNLLSNVQCYFCNFSTRFNKKLSYSSGSETRHWNLVNCCTAVWQNHLWNGLQCYSRWMTLKVIQGYTNCRYLIGHILVAWSKNDSILHRFRDINTFTVYMAACDPEKSFLFERSVEITSHVRFLILVSMQIINTYKCKKKLQFIHTVNGDGSKTAKIIKRQC